jgi:hypothetical protein
MRQPLLIVLLSLLSISIFGQTNYVQTAADLVSAFKDGEPYEQYVETLRNSTFDELHAELDTDAKKYAFWINVYNGYIQVELRNKPELYEKRNKFFGTPAIEIGGKTLSFSDVEHGIIRRGKWLAGLGYLRNPFPSKFKKKLRPKKSEYRVHFVLNCGAKSCPPIAVMDHLILEEQLSEAIRRYLPDYTSYDESTNEVLTTPLFSWFRGDFKGKRGTKRILEEQVLIPNRKVKLKYDGYDWSLMLDNFIELTANSNAYQQVTQ